MVATPKDESTQLYILMLLTNSGEAEVNRNWSKSPSTFPE